MERGLIARRTSTALMLLALVVIAPAEGAFPQLALATSALQSTSFQSPDTGRGRSGMPLTADLHVSSIERDLAQVPIRPFRRDEDGYILCMLASMANKVKRLGPGAEKPPEPGSKIVEEVLKEIKVGGREFEVEIRDLMGSLRDGENELFAVKEKDPVEPAMPAGDVIRHLFAPCMWYAHMGLMEVVPAVRSTSEPNEGWVPTTDTPCSGIAISPSFAPEKSDPEDLESSVPAKDQAAPTGGATTLAIDRLLCPPEEPPERLLMDLALAWAELVPIMHGAWPTSWDAPPCEQPRTSGPLSEEAKALCRTQHFIAGLRSWSHETSTQIEQAISAICAVGKDDPGASGYADSLLQALRQIPPQARNVMGWTPLTADALASAEDLCHVPPPLTWDTHLVDLKKTPAATQIEQRLSAICSVKKEDPVASRHVDSLLESLRDIPSETLGDLGFTTLTADALSSAEKLCAVPPPLKWDTLLADLRETPAVAAYMKGSDPSKLVLSAKDFGRTMGARSDLAGLLRGAPSSSAAGVREAVVPEAMWRVLARAEAFPLFSWAGAARKGVEVCLVATESPSPDGNSRRPQAGLVDVRFYLDVPRNLSLSGNDGDKGNSCAEFVDVTSDSSKAEDSKDKDSNDKVGRDDMENRRFMELATVTAIRWNPLLRRYLPQDSGIAQDMRVTPAALRHALEALGIPTLLLGEDPRLTLDMLSPASLKAARNVLEGQLDGLLHEGYLLREGMQDVEQVELSRTWYGKPIEVRTKAWEREFRSLAANRKRILDAAVSGHWPQDLEHYRIWLQAALACWENPDDCDERLAKLGPNIDEGRSARRELRKLVDASKGAVVIAVPLPALSGASGRPPEIVLRLGPGEKKLLVDLQAWQAYLANALKRSLPALTKTPLRIEGAASIVFGEIDVCLQTAEAGKHGCEPPAQEGSDAPALSGTGLGDPLSLQLVLPVTVTTISRNPQTGTVAPKEHPPLLIRAALTPDGGRLTLKWYPVPIPSALADDLRDSLKKVMYEYHGDVLATAKDLEAKATASAKDLEAKATASAKDLEAKKAALENWLRPMGIEIVEGRVRVTSRLSLPMPGDPGCTPDLELFGTVEWAPGDSAPRASIVGPDKASVEGQVKHCLKQGLTAWAESWKDGLAENVCEHLQSLGRSTGQAGMEICALAPPNPDGSAPQRVCQPLDGEADIGTFCTAELNDGRTLRLAFVAPEMATGKPRLAVGGIEVSRVSGKSQFDTKNAVLMAYREGSPGTLCESSTEGGQTRLADKHWLDACGAAPKLPAAELVLEALGIEKKTIGGAQVRFHVVPHPIKDGIAVAMHADLSSIQLGIPLRLPAYVPMGKVELTTEGVSPSLVNKEDILKTMEGAIALALAEELNAYLSSIDLGLDKGPKLSMDPTFTMKCDSDSETPERLQLAQYPEFSLKAVGCKRVAVFGQDVDVAVTLKLLPQFRLTLDAADLDGVVKKVTSTILGELTALTGGAGLNIEEPQFTEKPLGLTFKAKIDADPLGTIEFRRVLFDMRKRDIRIEFPVHFRLATPIRLEPIVLCAPYVRIEDRKLSAITIGADVTVAECQAAKLVNLRSSLSIRTAKPDFGLRADAVLILFDTLNVADAFGEVDANGVRFQARTLPPIDRLMSAQIKAAMGRFDSLEGVPAEVNPREGVFADASYVVFGLRTLDGMVYFNTHGKVLMSMAMNAPLAHLEARVASDPFPKNLDLSATGEVGIKGLSLGLDVAASDGYAGVGFRAYAVDLYVEAPGLRALGPDALLKAIMALLQFKVDLSTLNDADLAKLLSAKVKIKMSRPMGKSGKKPEERSSKRKRSSTEKAPEQEQGPKLPAGEETPMQRIPPAAPLDPKGLTELPAESGRGNVRADRYFLGGPGTGVPCHRYVNTVGASCLIRFGLRGSEICSGPEVFPHSEDELYRGSMPWLAAYDPLQRQRTYTEDTTLIGVPAVLRYPLSTSVGESEAKGRPRVPVRWVYRTLAEGGAVWSVMRQGPDAPCNESKPIARNDFLLDVPKWSFDKMVPTYSNDAVFRGLVSDATSNDTFAMSLLAWALWVHPKQSIKPDDLYKRFGGSMPEAQRPAGQPHPPDVHRVLMPESGVGVCRPSDRACNEDYYYVVPRHAKYRHALSKATWDVWFNGLNAADGVSEAPTTRDPIWETYVAHIHHGGVQRMHGDRGAGLIVGRWDWGTKAEGAPPPVDALSVCNDNSCEQLKVLRPPVPRGKTAPLACSSGQEAFLDALREHIGPQGTTERWIFSATASDEHAAVALWGTSDTDPRAVSLSGLLQAQSEGCAERRSSDPHRFTLKFEQLQALRREFGGARCWPDAPGDPASIEAWVNWIDVALSQPTKEACPSLVTYFKSLPPKETSP